MYEDSRSSTEHHKKVITLSSLYCVKYSKLLWMFSIKHSEADYSYGLFLAWNNFSHENKL